MGWGFAGPFVSSRCPMYQKPPSSFLMCTFACVACSGPKGDASAFPVQLQSPAKNDSCPTSGPGAGTAMAAGAAPFGASAASAGRAKTASSRPTHKDQLFIAVLLIISSLDGSAVRGGIHSTEDP